MAWLAPSALRIFLIWRGRMGLTRGISVTRSETACPFLRAMASRKPSMSSSKIWTFFAIVRFLSVLQPLRAGRLSASRSGLPVDLCRRETADKFRRRTPKNNTYNESPRVCLCPGLDFQHALYGCRPNQGLRFREKDSPGGRLEWRVALHLHPVWRGGEAVL